MNNPNSYNWYIYIINENIYEHNNLDHIPQQYAMKPVHDDHLMGY